MAKKLYEEASVQAIAAAIREKTGTAAKYKVAEMAAAVRDMETGPEAESYAFDQCRAEVERYLNQVAYDPADYTVSRIPDYVTTPSSNRPAGVTVAMKSAGTLTVIDGYTGNAASWAVRAGNVTIYNCTPGATSKFVLTDGDGRLVQSGVLKPTGVCRMIRMTNVDNVRDLGGWACDGGTVRYGKLFRGGEMYGYLTEDGKRQALDLLSIRKEIDLRSASDLKGRTQSGFGPTVDMLWVDMTWNALPYQKESGNIKAIFDPLLDFAIENKPTYFHCSAGADRTGVVALLCEAILGVSQSDCDKDYEITSFYTGVGTDAQARRRNETPWTREITYLNTFPGATFRDKTVNFMVSCGIPIEKINAFRAAMIDGEPETLTADISTYAVTKSLTDVSADNGAASVRQYQPYAARLVPVDGKLIGKVAVKMGGTDITASAFKGTAEALRRSVTQSLTRCRSSNARGYAIDGQSYVTALTADSGCTMHSATITMGGMDVSAFYKDGIISIPEVTGDIEITAEAVVQAPAYTNQLDNAVDMSGSRIGKRAMYTNKRYNSVSGDPVDNAGTLITGLVPCKCNDTVRIRWSGNSDGSYQTIKAFKSDRTQCAAGYVSFQMLNTNPNIAQMLQYDPANGICDFKLIGTAALNGAAYLAIVLYESDIQNVIVAVNEEIV